VNPVLYTVTGDYDQDLARQVPMLPGLDRIRQLGALAPDSDDYRMVRTRIVRERNRVEDALDRATRAAERLVRDLA
jgi:predicted Zn-dependent protease